MSRSTWAWISLGGNEGDGLQAVARRLESAVAHLATLAAGPVVISPVYRTPPWGVTDQQDFLNQIAGFPTARGPEALLAALLEIEAAHGRVRRRRWGPRTLDLDLLMLGSTLRDTAALTLPHPRLADRRFVLQPWADVAPEVQVPGHDRTVAALLAACPDGSALSPWSP